MVLDLGRVGALAVGEVLVDAALVGRTKVTVTDQVSHILIREYDGRRLVRTSQIGPRGGLTIKEH
jgi:hypothetical protein